MAPPLPVTIRRLWAVGVVLAVVGLLFWGGLKWLNWIIERGGTPWPFRRLPFNENMQQSNNSWRRRWKGFRGGRATGAKHVGRTVALRLGRLLENKKIERGMGHLPLWWPPFYWGTQQSNKSRLRRWGGRWRGDATSIRTRKKDDIDGA